MTAPNRIKKWRTLSELSQDEVMKRTGIHQSLLSRIERGYRQATPAEKEALARVFKVTVQYVFPETKEDR
jgi:transcriptional regulator with XRE-family HTH domain